MQYNIINVADIPFEDGTTPRQRNNAMSHVIDLGSKVSYSDYDDEGNSFDAEGFVLSYIRDCDGTPLYMVGDKFELIQTYQEADRKYHEIQEKMKGLNGISFEAHELQDKSDEQVSIMFKAFRKFNNPYSIDSLEVIEQSTDEKLAICQSAQIIWGAEFYNRFYNKRLFG